MTVVPRAGGDLLVVALSDGLIAVFGRYEAVSSATDTAVKSATVSQQDGLQGVALLWRTWAVGATPTMIAARECCVAQAPYAPPR